MDLDDLAGHVGAEFFRRACRHARATAPGAGRELAPWSSEGSGSADPSEQADPTEQADPIDLADVPHELADLVEDDLDLALALYRAMPCYANLMYIDHWASRADLFRGLRSLLDHEDAALADPASYWLWCGPFEEREDGSAAAWQAMTADATERRLGRLLDVSGPVPWSAKGPVLESLAGHERWHPAIWRAVRDGVTDVFGRIDAAAAQLLVARLTRPPEEIDTDDLSRRLHARAT